MTLRNFIPKTGLDTEHLHKYIDRIDASIEDDPSLAIGSTKELIEATLKTILIGCSFEFDDRKDDVPTLLKKTQKVLKLAPDNIDNSKRGADTIKKILNNLGSIAVGIAELRNFYGSGHGKGHTIQGITSRHARLAVSSATTLCTFLLETYEHREKLNLEHLRGKLPKYMRTLSVESGKTVRCVAFHPNNQILASGGEDHRLRIWELATGQILHEYTRYYHQTRSGDINALTFSQDGEFIAITGFVGASGDLQDKKQEKIQILKWKTGEIVDYVPSAFLGDKAHAIASSSSSNVIAFDSKNKIELYDIASRKNIKGLDGSSKNIRAISFSSDGKILVSGDEDGQVMVWSWQESDSPEQCFQTLTSVNTIAINSEKEFIAVGTESPKIVIINLSSRKVYCELDGHLKAINSLAFCPDGQILASASKDDTIKLWHVKTGILLNTLDCGSRWRDVPSISFSPDGKILAAGLSGGEIKLWQRV